MASYGNRWWGGRQAESQVRRAMCSDSSSDVPSRPETACGEGAKAASSNETRHHVRYSLRRTSRRKLNCGEETETELRPRAIQAPNCKTPARKWHKVDSRAFRPTFMIIHAFLPNEFGIAPYPFTTLFEGV